MKPTEIRALFDEVLQGELDAEQRARLELLREYLTNPTFRKELETLLFELNHTALRKEFP